MKSGGYKVIDLKNIPLSNFSVKMPGIYEQIEASNKLCVVSGLNAGSVEYDDVAVLFTGGSTFTAKIHDTLTLSVTDDDKVSVYVHEEVKNVPYIDMLNIDTSNSKITGNIVLFRLFANRLASKIPFYLKSIDLEFVDGDSEMKECTVMVVSSHTTATYGVGSFMVINEHIKTISAVVITLDLSDNYAINFNIIGGK